MIINIVGYAKEALNELFKNYDLTLKYVRIYLKEIAWHGPVFNVALDEPTSNDVVFNVDDIHIIINEDLCTKFNIVNIYYRSNLSYSDFYITTDLVWKDEYHYTNWGKPW